MSDKSSTLVDKCKDFDTNDLTPEEMAMAALIKARDAFLQYFEDEGCDAAYWDYRFTAWVVDSSFEHRLTRVEIEHEVKEGT